MTASELIKALQKLGTKAQDLEVQVYDEFRYMIVDDAKITTEENDYGVKETFIELGKHDC